MEPIELMDIERFSEDLTPLNENVFHQWSMTANEISRTIYRQVSILRQAYLEVQPGELKPRHVESFVDSLIRLMPSLEEKKTLIRIEAPQYKKFV